MSTKLKITVLVENTAQGPKLLAEHGLAFWVEVGSHCLLLDAGQGGVLTGNAHHLGIALDRLEVAVLSHGHYDHTGGLADALRGNPTVNVYAHPAALEPKYAETKDGVAREIGIPYPSQRAIERRRDRLVLTEKPTDLGFGLTATGPVPRATEFEETGGRFFLDTACRTPDDLLDDQAVFFKSTRGTVVLLGCAHSGVINTLRYVRQLTGDRPIHAVFGGMHLVNASKDRIGKTIDRLCDMKIDLLGPAHCTGRAATAALWDAFPDQCVACHVGTRLEFDLPGVSNL